MPYYTPNSCDLLTRRIRQAAGTAIIRRQKTVIFVLLMHRLLRSDSITGPDRKVHSENDTSRVSREIYTRMHPSARFTRLRRAVQAIYKTLCLPVNHQNGFKPLPTFPAFLRCIADLLEAGVWDLASRDLYVLCWYIRITDRGEFIHQAHAFRPIAYGPIPLL